MRERSPLDWWHHAADQSREATALLNEVDEVYVRAANKGGKTEWEYAAGIAMLQKRPALDGVPLPQWRGKVEGISIEPDHEQQKLSSQQTVLRLLGDWPHHASWKANGTLATVRIKPVNGGDDQGRWSTLTFMSQENRRTGTGVRADLVLGNEPPREDIWREIRKAAHAGRRIVRIIGATPIKRREWQWLKDDYGVEAPRGGIRRQANRAEVRWSLHDNKALTKREIDALLAEYWGDPSRETPADLLYYARVFGDYIDTSGLCPFNVAALNRMLAECEPADEREWRIQREVETEEGRPRVEAVVVVHVLKDADPLRRYYLCIDPSKGIADRAHDPGGLLVSDLDTGEDVAMYEGYIGSYGLGVLGAGLARQYNNALVDVESNSGWAEGVYRGLGDCGYTRLAKTKRMAQNGAWETRLGWETTNLTRPAIIEAVQAWANAYGAGISYAPCKFRRVIETLLDVILDEDGKPVAMPGAHDEFMILKGQALRKTMPGRVDANLTRPLVVPAAMTADERIMAKLMSDTEGSPPRVGGGTIPKPRPRPGG